MTTPLETAVTAWNACQANLTVDERTAYARQLADCDVFSNVHIVAITGLGRHHVDLANPKSSKTGGRFNPEALPLMLDFHAGLHPTAHGWGARDGELARTIVATGTSPRMFAKLVGVPATTIERWISQYEAAQ